MHSQLSRPNRVSCHLESQKPCLGQRGLRWCTAAVTQPAENTIRRSARCGNDAVAQSKLGSEAASPPEVAQHQPAATRPPRASTTGGDEKEDLSGLARGAGSAAASLLMSAAVTAQVLLSALLAPSVAVARQRLTPDEQLTIDIFKASQPSVVSVTNLATRRDAFTTNMMEIPQGTGSGFIWDKQGRIVTNFHVITDSQGVKVALRPGGTEYSAKLVGTDQDKDIAVLQIDLDKEDLVVQPLNTCSSSADLIVGQKVYAIGNPFGLDHTLTTGVVSGTGREIQAISGRPIQDVIQTDAAINPGNSGGPLLDSSGCVIGINTAIYSPSGASTGVGFAIPVDIVKSSVQQILKYGRVVRPVIGISFAPDQSSEQIGVKGILVLSSREGGPAWKAGIRGTSRAPNGRLIIGDVITAINGQAVKTASDLYRILDKCKVGDVLDVEVLRDDATVHVSITLESSEEPPNLPKPIPPRQMPMPLPPPGPLPLPVPTPPGGGPGEFPGSPGGPPGVPGGGEPLPPLMPQEPFAEVPGRS